MSIETPQWPMLREVLRQQRLMDDMMERCGVDVVDLIRCDRGKSFADARGKCRLCLAASTCQEWLLALGNNNAVLPPEFCPNAELFSTSLRKQAGV
jgi:hypothetical protein